jgi:hypothetical protein
MDSAASIQGCQPRLLHTAAATERFASTSSPYKQIGGVCSQCATISAARRCCYGAIAPGRRGRKMDVRRSSSAPAPVK